jgi:hypothetical protein
VSISSTFYEQLFVKAFFYLQFGFVIFCSKNIAAKAARKMMVKLTLGGSARDRTPSPGNFVRHKSPPSHFRRFSPEAVSPTPIRALGSVLPLNLSKASGGMFAHNDDEGEPDFRSRLSPEDRQGQSISPFHETAPTPHQINPLSPASNGSTTPPQGIVIFASKSSCPK